MRIFILAFISGLIFGFGLIISQMVNPYKVISFLNIFGDWDPSLAFVMGGAVIVTFFGYRILKTHDAAFTGVKMRWPTRTDVDPPLIIGAALFGIGWGMSGLCPGPAITAIPAGGMMLLQFIGAMLVGMILMRLIRRGA